MYLVRLRETDGKVVEKAEFPNVGEALRHLDALVISYPQLVSELRGTTGVLFRHDPSAGRSGETAAVS